jgi:hypothetical protein
MTIEVVVESKLLLKREVGYRRTSAAANLAS